MTKRDRALEFARDFNRKVAKRLREEKKKAFEDVVAKGKIETYGDLFAVLGKLSRRAKDIAALGKLSRGAKDIAALNRIQVLAGMGYGPVKIVELMEPKRNKEGETKW